MKVFFFFFLAATIICGYFWATDAPGSGMAWPTLGFGALAIGVGGWNWYKNGSPLSDKANSFTLPILLAIHLDFSAWWLVGVALVALWIWALTRTDEGTGDYGRGIGPALCILLAFVVTVCLLGGIGLGKLLNC